MTSSYGDIPRVSVPLCGEFIGHRWIPRTKVIWGLININVFTDDEFASYLQIIVYTFDIIICRWLYILYGFTIRTTLNIRFLKNTISIIQSRSWLKDRGCKINTFLMANATKARIQIFKHQRYRIIIYDVIADNFGWLNGARGIIAINSFLAYIFLAYIYTLLICYKK